MLSEISSCTKVILFLLLMATSPVPSILQGGQVKTLQLRASEGDSLFIPCLNPDRYEVSVWNISSSLYSVSELPPQYEVQYNGLFVRNVLLNTGGIYSCYRRVGSGYDIELISEIELSVKTEVQGRLLFGGTNSNTGRILRLLANEDDTIFIPCINPNEYDISVWRIEGSLYATSELPPSLVAEYNGLLLYGVSERTRGLYSCYRRSDNGYEISLISEIVLDVSNRLIINSEDFNTELGGFVSQFKINLVTQNISFGVNEKQFGWTSDPVTSNLTLTIEVFNESKTVDYVLKRKTTMDQVFTIPSLDFEPTSNLIFLFANDSNNNVGNLSYVFRVNASELTVDLCTNEGGACFLLPKNYSYEGDLVASWPKVPGSNSDCRCPVVTPISDCHCFKHNTTSYNVEFQDYNATFIQICWVNLTVDQNSTSLVLFRDTSNFTSTNQFIHHRYFVNSGRIFITGPKPNKPNFDVLDESTICYNNSEEIPGSTVLSFTVEVHDITALLVSNVSTNSSDCIKLPPRSVREVCAPFTISAVAHSRCSSSDVGVFNTTGQGNLCKCIQTKLNVSNITVQINSEDQNIVNGSFTVTVLCPTRFEIDIPRVFMEVIPTSGSDDRCTGNKSLPVPVDCSVPVAVETLKLANLCPSRMYNVSVLWISIDGSNCSVSNNFTFTTITNKDSSEQKLQLGIGLGVSLLVLIIVALFVFGILYYYIRHKRKKPSEEQYEDLDTS